MTTIPEVAIWMEVGVVVILRLTFWGDATTACDLELAFSPFGTNEVEMILSEYGWKVYTPSEVVTSRDWLVFLKLSNFRLTFCANASELNNRNTIIFLIFLNFKPFQSGLWKGYYYLVNWISWVEPLLLFRWQIRSMLCRLLMKI